MSDLVFSAPPGWPQPPPGWTPPSGWTPDPNWPPAPLGWTFWTVAAAQVPAPVVAQPTTDRYESADENPEDIAEAVATSDSTPTAVDPTEQNVSLEPRPSQGQTSLVAEVPATHHSNELIGLQAQVIQAQMDLAASQAQVDRVRGELVELDDAVVLQQVGIYQYHHPLENAEEYRQQCAELQREMREAVKNGEAVLVSTMFSYNNSLAAGRKMTNDFSKLMLRAYNAEADNSLRTLRAGNVVSAKTRLEKTAAIIARLGAMMEMRIAPSYHSLRLRELELTADYLMKVQEEREQIRAERDRLREEQRAQQEIARERERLNKERTHYLTTFQKLAEQGRDDETAELHQRLQEIDAAIEQNEFRAANIRTGSVYVISNIGTFGEAVVKIGMTRRLDPMERVRELGDASVPFPYDVHAIFFSKDAVTLENELHKAFADRRVNHVNTRREFFFATPSEVRDVLIQKVGNLLEFTEKPEATQYFQSRGLWTHIDPPE